MIKSLFTFFLLTLMVNTFPTYASATKFIEPDQPADKGNLSGKVIDALTGKPLQGAAIYLHESRTGAISAADGSFKTPLVPVGKYLVEISFMGYASFLQTIDIGVNTVRDFALKTEVVENEAVTVTGVASAMRTKQTAQPVSIIKRGDLQRTSSTNIIDAVSRLVPGVAALNTGPAISKPIIRGLGYNRVITMHDGVRQEGQQWGDEHGIEIDEASVQRVELLKGPASLLYGSDGMGGVVNIITNIPVEEGVVRANLNSGFINNNGLFSNNGNIAGHLKNGFNWNVYGSFKSAKDYQNKYDGRVLNSRFNERNFGGYIGINKSWGYSHLLVSNFNQNLGLVEGDRDATTGQFLMNPGTSLEKIADKNDLNARNIQIPGQGINHFKIASDNNIALGNGRLNLNIGYQRNQRKEFGDALAPSTAGLYFDLHTINYNVQYQFAEKNGWKTALGMNGMWQQNNNKAEEVLIPEYNQLDAGIFVYTRKTFDNKFTLSGGLRGDYRKLNSKGFIDAGGDTKFTEFEKTFGNFSGSIGFSYNASDAVTLKANMARAYRAPSVSELASNGTHEGTNRYEYGNQNLKTETALQLDAGIEVNTQHMNFLFNVFYNHINNYIFYSKLSNTAGGDSLVNVNGDDILAFNFKQNTAALYGFETKIDIHPHPLDWLHFANTFSMVAGKFNTSFEGVNRLPFIPPARLITELRGDFKKAGTAMRNLYVKLEMDNMFSQNRVFSAYNTETATNGFTLFNFGIGADMVRKGRTLFSMQLALNNMADIAYQNHLSRLKYTADNLATGRTGVFNMGRNFSIRMNIPMEFKIK
jgi:iron complex outermembrane receptor protein